MAQGHDILSDPQIDVLFAEVDRSVKSKEVFGFPVIKLEKVLSSVPETVNDEEARLRAIGLGKAATYGGGNGHTDS
jgi:hypothetical protein